MIPTDGETFDVLVIGSGIAGLSAACAAADRGARVAGLERTSPEEFGGNTRWTESYLRMKSEHEVSDDFEELLVANAGHHIDPNVIAEASQPYDQWSGYVKAHGMPDPELVSTLSAGAGPTVQWLKGYGIRFDTLPTYFVTAAAPRLMPVGGGLAMITALQSHARQHGVSLYFHATAFSLSRRDADGWLNVGIAAGDKPGDDGQLHWPHRALSAAGGPRRLLQQRRGYPSGLGAWRCPGRRFQLLSCRTAGSAFACTRSAGHELSLRNSGQSEGASVHRRSARSSGRELRSHLPRHQGRTGRHRMGCLRPKHP